MGDLSRRTIIGATIGRARNARRRRHSYRSIPSLQIVLRAWSYCARADLLSFQALRHAGVHVRRLEANATGLKSDGRTALAFFHIHTPPLLPRLFSRVRHVSYTQFLSF